MSLIFFDIETTSLKSPARRPWELAFIDENGIADLFHVLDLDLNGCDPESLNKSGYWRRYEKDPYAKRWTEYEIALSIEHFTKDKVLVGCAPWFDEAVLKEMFARHDLEPKWSATIDIQKSVKLSIGRTRVRPPRGLKACAEYLKIDYDANAAHSALYDASLAKEIFEKVPTL